MVEVFFCFFCSATPREFIDFLESEYYTLRDLRTFINVTYTIAKDNSHQGKHFICHEVVRHYKNRLTTAFFILYEVINVQWQILDFVSLFSLSCNECSAVFNFCTYEKTY